jgi:hypothetical protein
MFRRIVFSLACVSIGCGTVEGDSTDASAPSADAPAGDDDGGLAVDAGPQPGEPDADPGAPLVIGDGSHDFQRVTIGASGQPFTTKVTNQSSVPIGPLAVALTGDAAAEFAVSDDSCNGRTLGAGTDCQLTVNFQPGQPGARSARLDVTGGDTTVTMNLAGIGLTLGALAITPGDGHNFGNVSIGQTSTAHVFMVTNTGESPIARPTLSVLDDVNFSIDDNTCVAELAPLGTCTVTASFSPSVGGVSTSSLVVSSGTNMAAASLAGTGRGQIIVRKTGDGASVSAVVGGGIDCGGTCQATIGDRSVALVASVPANTELSAWSIASCGTSARCEVPVDRATATVDVTFRNRYQVSVTRSGSGTGRVVATGGGIDCGNDCSEMLFAQTQLVLRATPDTGNVLAGWTGCTSSSGDTCNVTVAGTGPQAVTARFERTHTLTVSVSGSGTVTSNPAGISCANDCTEAYAEGTAVVLTANPGNGQRLTSWGGSCSGSASTCTVSMAAARSVQATFGARYVLTVTPSVPNSAITVSPGPSGSSVICTFTSGCTYTYTGRATVALFADHPSPLTWRFVGWSGACSGTANSCGVDVNNPVSATTNYAPQQ